MRPALIITLSALFATPSLADQSQSFSTWSASAAEQIVFKDRDGNRGGVNCKPPHNCTER